MQITDENVLAAGKSLFGADYRKPAEDGPKHLHSSWSRLRAALEAGLAAHESAASDMETIGRAFMARYDDLVINEPRLAGYAPAECPTEIVDDLLAMVDEAVALSQAEPAALAGQEGASLDERMKAAGMIPLSDLLAGNTPLEKWMAHTGVRDLDSFEQWLTGKQREFMTMRVAYELGDKDESDELYEWVFAHAAAFGEVAANFRAMKERSPAPAGVPSGWPEAYAAFVGAFDTPLSRRQQDDEFANDARKRLREFNEAVMSAAPAGNPRSGD